MDIGQISNLLNNLSFTLLAIAPTVFVFSVTLLGDAIERSQQEEKAARENEKSSIQKNIFEVESSLKEVKKNGDTTQLTSKLDELKNAQEKTDDQIKEIKTKYKSIDITNTVFSPCLAFLVVLSITPFTNYIKAIIPGNYYILVIVVQLILIGYGIKKICQCLLLVQQISSNKKASEYFERLKESFRLALEEDRQKNEEDVSIEFIDKAFPLNVAISMDLNIKFRVKLSKGAILHNTSVWFYVSDGFELVQPTEAESWKQDSDYSPPYIRTVEIKIGTLSKGPFMSGSLKLKTPAVSGKYLLRYGVRADGYTAPNKDLTILVG